MSANERGHGALISPCLRAAHSHLDHAQHQLLACAEEGLLGDIVQKRLVRLEATTGRQDGRSYCCRAACTHAVQVGGCRGVHEIDLLVLATVEVGSNYFQPHAAIPPPDY